MKGNKRLLVILLPIAVVIPLLIVTWFIGAPAVWLWAGIGIGMVVFSAMQKKEAA